MNLKLCFLIQFFMFTLVGESPANSNPTKEPAQGTIVDLIRRANNPDLPTDQRNILGNQISKQAQANVDRSMDGIEEKHQKHLKELSTTWAQQPSYASIIIQRIKDLMQRVNTEEEAEWLIFLAAPY